MQRFLRALILVGVILACSTINPVLASPFTEDEIIVPTETEIEDSVTGIVETINESGEEVIEAVGSAASATSSLWNDISKLYGVFGNPRGKRKKDKSEPANEHHLSGFDELEIDIDGDNYCGQFAMSALLNGMGIETDPQEVYKTTNPGGIFTAPSIIVEHLRMSGVDAKMKNKASVKDIAKRIDDGKPVMVLVDSGSGTPHWICITGYDTDDEGNIVSLRMRDSYWGTDGAHTMDIEKFEKAWNSPFGSGTLSTLTNYSNVLVDNNGTCDPSSTTPLYPGTFNTATEDNMASGINDVVTGWKNHSVSQVIGGATKLVLGLPGAITGVASNFLDNKSQGWMNWGKDKLNQDGFGNKLLGGAAIVGGGITNGVAKVGKAASDLWSSGASVIGNGIKKLGSLFS